MYRNSIWLPLIALLIVLLGAGLLYTDFQMKQMAEQTPPEAAAAGPPVADGQIAAGEYQHHYADEKLHFDLYWTISDGRIYLGMKSPAKGWIALSLAPKGPMMQGGDILIGYVENGEAHLRDDYAAKPTSHQADTELGGKNDILSSGGSQSEQGTIIELSRKLDTGDKYDNPIVQGPMAVQIAYAKSNNFTGYHLMSRAALTLDFYIGKAGAWK